MDHTKIGGRWIWLAGDTLPPPAYVGILIKINPSENLGGDGGPAIPWQPTLCMLLLPQSQPTSGWKWVPHQRVVPTQWSWEARSRRSWAGVPESGSCVSAPALQLAGSVASGDLTSLCNVSTSVEHRWQWYIVQSCCKNQMAHTLLQYLLSLMHVLVCSHCSNTFGRRENWISQLCL